MKINLFQINYTKILAFIGWGLFFATLLFKGCVSEKKTITIPEKKGKFTSTDIFHKPIYLYDTILKRQTKFRTKIVQTSGIKDSLYYVIEKDYNQLFNSYIKEVDSLKALTMFQNAIQINEFSKTFEDSVVKIDVSGIVQGQVKLLETSYNVKPQKISMPQKWYLRAYGGLGSSLKLDNVIFEAGLGYQTKKGTIYNVGVDSEKRIKLNTNFIIF